MVPFYGDTLLRVGILAILMVRPKEDSHWTRCVKVHFTKAKMKNQYKVIDGMRNGNGNKVNINGGHGRTKRLTISI